MNFPILANFAICPIFPKLCCCVHGLDICYPHRFSIKYQKVNQYFYSLNPPGLNWKKTFSTHQHFLVFKLYLNEAQVRRPKNIDARCWMPVEVIVALFVVVVVSLLIRGNNKFISTADSKNLQEMIIKNVQYVHLSSWTPKITLKNWLN